MTPTLQVMNEWHTLAMVRQMDLSLSRYGDGEIKIMMGQSIKSQEANIGLAKRLRQVAQDPSDSVLVCIPRIFEGIPAHKLGFWERYSTDPERLRFFRGDRVYGSAFVTRPDHFVELDHPTYWNLWRSIWNARPVLFLRGVAGDGREPHHYGMLDNASSLKMLGIPPSNAWAWRKSIYNTCMAWHRDCPDGLVVMAAGATATVLCHQLGEAGVQAIDAGHVFRYYRDRGKIAAGAGS
jgi:hypothetical protein